ncbi:MAG: hypothetical protein V3V32_03225 [Dehalococcoidia bacterium]
MTEKTGTADAEYEGYNLEAAEASVGKGWHGLLKILMHFKPKGTIVMQVKEKYGGLRFYVSGTEVEYLDLIQELEASSRTICESCGKAGFNGTEGGNPHGWYKTACLECEPDHKKPVRE